MVPSFIVLAVGLILSWIITVLLTDYLGIVRIKRKLGWSMHPEAIPLVLFVLLLLMTFSATLVVDYHVPGWYPEQTIRVVKSESNRARVEYSVTVSDGDLKSNIKVRKQEWFQTRTSLQADQCYRAHVYGRDASFVFEHPKTIVPVETSDECPTWDISESEL